jgi:hypothetical protein
MVPPLAASEQLPAQMRAVQEAAVALADAWRTSIDLVHDLISWSGPKTDLLAEDEQLEDEGEEQGASAA